MKHIRLHVDKCFKLFIAIIVLFQMCLFLNDTNAKTVMSKISNIVEPKRYLIGKVALLFANWCPLNSISIARDINGIFKELGINARLIENTIKTCGGSYEFFVYIPKYKRDFLFRYTPLIKNLAKLVQDENFRLEVKSFSNWKPVAVDQLFT